MDSDEPSSGAKARGTRNLEISLLKSREEGGTKKDYEDFLEKIGSHVTINWDFGSDVAYVIKNSEEPEIEEPVDLSEEDEKVKWKMLLWKQQVIRYGYRVNALSDNLGALHSLIFEKLTKIMKAKVRSKKGFLKADKEKDAVWLLGILDDIVLNFEETKPIYLALDDQMEVIMNLKQGKMTNEDFVKLVTKELKVYEKYGGRYLWGKFHDKKLKTELTKAKEEYLDEHGQDMDEDMEEEVEVMIEKEMKESILAMTILKRADSRRYGSLQKELANSYLLGKNEYPTSVPDLLKVLNNYEAKSPDRLSCISRFPIVGDGATRHVVFSHTGWTTN